MVALPPETPFTLQAKLAPGLPISRTENCWVEFTRRTAPGGLIAIGPTTRKAVGEAAEPRGAVTAMGPLVAPAGTAVRRRLGAAAVTGAGGPLKATAVWPAGGLKPLPESSTVAATAAPVG